MWNYHHFRRLHVRKGSLSQKSFSSCQVHIFLVNSFKLIELLIVSLNGKYWNFGKKWMKDAKTTSFPRFRLEKRISLIFCQPNDKSKFWQTNTALLWAECQRTSLTATSTDEIISLQNLTNMHKVFQKVSKIFRENQNVLQFSRAKLLLSL